MFLNKQLKPRRRSRMKTIPLPKIYTAKISVFINLKEEFIYSNKLRVKKL